MNFAKNEQSIWFDNGNNTPSPTSPDLHRLASLKFTKQRSNSQAEFESPSVHKTANSKVQLAEEESKSVEPNSQTQSTQSSTTQGKASSKRKHPQQRRAKQPQERYGACPAVLNPDSQFSNDSLKQFKSTILFNKAMLTESHYSYFYYSN